MAKRKRRPANDRAYARYKAEDRYFKNRVKRLERHLKDFPEDEQAKERLEKGNFKYRRKRPIKSLTAREKEFNRLKKLAKNTNVREPEVPEWKQILADAFGRKPPKIYVKRRRRV